jgi:hypothetical protein
MSKQIRTTESALKTIRDTAASPRRVEPRDVATAIGAEASGASLEEALAPITLFALREELLSRLQSNGGRPGLAGATRRVKIPLSDTEWLELEELASAISSPGFAPSAGQVASVLLTLSAHSIASQVSGSGSPLVNELAARLGSGRR